MTEQEWLECADPECLLTMLTRKATSRKQRLFAVACCRRIWHYLTEEGFKQTVNAIEQLADAPTQQKEQWKKCRRYAIVARKLLRDSGHELTLGYHAVLGAGVGDARLAAQNAAKYAAAEVGVALARDCATRGEEWRAIVDDARSREQKAQAKLLRDIFRPFRPVRPNAAWLSSTVTSLAQAIYEEHAFDRLPILADALEDAGCDNADLLNHCRQPGDHVRGCWCVDLILGRE